MASKANLSIPTQRPLPALPVQTPVDLVTEQNPEQFPERSTPKSYTEVLHGTLAGLKHLELTGRVTYDTDCPYLSGGAYGDIRIGRCNVAGRGEVKVAIKCLRLYLQDSPDIAKLIEREVRVWSRLKHPNILSLMGYVIEQHGLPSFISEFMENGTVLKYVQTHPECDIMHMVLGLAEGISYLHGARIIHSDIKSDNVLVSRLGDPLICDFGISRLLAVSQTMGGRSIQAQSSTVRGSARWMSPELLLPSGEHATHSEESDIWAFGMTVYEILAKNRPYHHLACDPQVITSIIYGHLPIKPGAFLSWSEHYAQLWSICEACWQENPDSRPSASQVVSILRALYYSVTVDTLSTSVTVEREHVAQELLETAAEGREIATSRKDRAVLPTRKTTYDTFADMGIRGRKLEVEDKKCIIM